MMARAQLLSGEEAKAAGQLIDRKYPVLQRLLVRLAHKITRTPTLHYELSPSCDVPVQQNGGCGRHAGQLEVA